MHEIVTVIGAEGFVGSAFVRLLALKGVQLIQVTRQSYEGQAGRFRSTVTIDCAGNPFRHVALNRPVEDFERTVVHRMRTLHDFPADLQIHVSSVDVADGSVYGFHKDLAEQLVRWYSERWFTVRLAGMVGPRLRKNIVFDILNERPIFVHPDSQYRFMNTDDVAQIVWVLRQKQFRGTISVCGEGMISPAEIAKLAGKKLDLSQVIGPPRITPGAGPEMLSAFIPAVPRTVDTIRAFVHA